MFELSEACGTKQGSTYVFTSGGLKGDERATFGIRDCPHVRHRDRAKAIL